MELFSMRRITINNQVRKQHTEVEQEPRFENRKSQHLNAKLLSNSQ